MIKQLIEDLAYNKITLGHSLTRAKLIASRTQNKIFKEWVGQELQGYNNDDQLPSYRKVGCQTFVVVNLPYGRQQVIPLAVNDPDVKEYYNEHRICNSISEIESLLKDLGNELIVTLQLPSNLAVSMADLFKNDIQNLGGALEGVRQKVSKSAYVNIIELTRQKLLDTLLELHEQFPNLEDEFTVNRENLKTVDAIVNNHIYGNNNPVNIAAGENITQKEMTYNISYIDYSKLENLGVSKEEIDELKNIVEVNQKDKPALKEKVMKWVLPVVTGAVARGVYDAAPKIMEFAHEIIR